VSDARSNLTNDDNRETPAVMPTPSLQDTTTGDATTDATSRPDDHHRTLSDQAQELLRERQLAEYPKKATFLPERIPFNDDARTVLVLDDYRNDEMFLKDEHGFSHGELNARLLEERGFNAIRLQAGIFKPGFLDIDQSLKDVNAGIDSGAVKLGRGDIVNISLGLNKTFTEASTMLGMEITAENLREKRPEILEGIRAKAVDPETPRHERAFLKQVVRITEQIEKLQERGITVTTAEGNRGTDNFNIGLLAADKHYSALTADGQLAQYSAQNSLTTDARADIDFKAFPLDMFDPTPFEQQKGHYRVDGTDIKLSAADFGGFWESAAPGTPEAQALMRAPATVDGGNPTVIPLSPADTETWRYGAYTLGVQGTSFADTFGIPADFSNKSERDKSFN
jgi:hypothetical protein